MSDRIYLQIKTLSNGSQILKYSGVKLWIHVSLIVTYQYDFEKSFE